MFVYAPKEWRLQYAKTNPLVKAKDEKGIKDEVKRPTATVLPTTTLHPEPLG